MGKQKGPRGVNHDDFMRLSDMNDDGVTMSHVDPTLTVEGKEETWHPATRGTSADPHTGEPSKVIMQNVSNLGNEGAVYQFEAKLPPVSEWDKPEYKAMIEREFAKANAMSNEPAMLKQAALDQIASGNAASSPQGVDELTKSAFVAADPQPLIPEKKKSTYADPLDK